MDKVLLTIAIPTYNNKGTILKAIDSCLNQKTDLNYEILIANNASTDGTGEIVNNLKDVKIRVVNNGKLVHSFENHNVCLKNSRGKYVLFCHSDDVLEDHAVEIIAQKLRQRNFPKKYVLWGNSMFRDFSRAVLEAGFNLNEIIVGEYSPLLFLVGGGLTPSGTCYSRESFLELGGFLKVKYEIGPSDMTTMIYLALNGFRFEMMSEMLFIRKFASTSTPDIKLDYALNAKEDAFEQLFKILEQSEIDKLLQIGRLKFERCMYFYCFLSKYPIYKKSISKIAIKEFIKSPLSIGRKVFMKMIRRFLF